MHQFYSILKNGIALPSFEGAHDTSQYTLHHSLIVCFSLELPCSLARLRLGSSTSSISVVPPPMTRCCNISRRDSDGGMRPWGWKMYMFVVNFEGLHKKRHNCGCFKSLLALIKLSYVSGRFFWKNNLSKPTPFQYFATWLLAFSGSPHAGVPAGGFWGCGYVRSALSTCLFLDVTLAFCWWNGTLLTLLLFDLNSSLVTIDILSQRWKNIKGL